MYKLKISKKGYKKMFKDEDKFDECQAGTDLNAMKILGIHNTNSKECWCNPKIISFKLKDK